MALVPVTLITGFLGAGKTTILNRLLGEGSLRDAALVINEFGDIGIDHLLVESADEGIVELSDGCLCCTIRGDLVDTLLRLLSVKGDKRPNRIVVESTGLADPAPILQAIMGHPQLQEVLRLDGVITIVDAVHGEQTLDNHPEAVRQVAMADRVMISKRDLQPDIEKLEARLNALNPGIRFVLPEDGAALSDQVFDCGLYNPLTKIADVSGWLRDEAVKAQSRGHHHHHDVNRHDRQIQAHTMASDRAIDQGALLTFIDLLRSAHGPDLLRVKGIFRMSEDPDHPVVIHGVQTVFHPPARLPAWPDDDRRSRLVLIARNMPDHFARGLFNALMGEVSVDTPDRKALDDNPLAIAGVKL